MKKYRTSLLLLAIALTGSVLHFYFGWQNSLNDAADHGQSLYLKEYFYLWAKETFESFPSEFSSLAIELALFAGIFKLFKPYDEDTEHIKNLEEHIDKRLDEISKRLD